MYENELKELGLTENQSKIYLLLLNNGALSSSEISKELGFHRGYIYDTLESMQEKEVINSHIENNKKIFQATNPNDLLNLLKLKIDNIEKITPELNQLYQNKKESFKIEVYKGKKAFRTLITDIISNTNENEEIYFLGLDEELLLTEIEPFYFKKFLNIMESKHINEKVIIKKGKKKMKFVNMFHKEIDENYLGDIMQIIYKNKTAIFNPGTNHSLIIIDNESISNNYKKQFKLLWSIAK
ncbi:MAG: helix-turn-helix domain-containing protein [Nanoarchaeota archaeon]|nr:helix-turn-helix domain-containing protein [Nanoarchaeota archaeon]